MEGLIFSILALVAMEIDWLSWIPSVVDRERWPWGRWGRWPR